MTGRLEGKVAIITGAAMGLGAADAELFASEGAQVVLTDIAEDKGQALADKLSGTFFKHDVTDEDRWIEIINETEKKYGRIDVLVNNAGIVKPGDPENQTTEIKERFLERLEARTAVLIEEERVTGPDYRMVAPGGVPAQAIQMGSYNMTSVENEIEIGKWYAQIRLPFVSEVKGAIRARKMVSTVGWAKHSVLYEFTSHEDRRQNIVREFDPFSKKTIGETIHAPGSPSIGHRIWPPVEKQK